MKISHYTLKVTGIRI